MDLGLEGKRALVLGGSSGLGRAIGQALAHERVAVALASRSEVRVAAAAKDVGARIGLVCDLSRAGAGGEVVAAAVAALGGLDVLVCNTGGPPKGSFAEITESQWRESFQGLWLSTVDAIQAALPQFTKGHFGRILLVTSVAAKEPMPALTLSNGLRAGLAGLAKSLSNEVARHGVTVNCLLPGYTDTDRLRELAVPPEKMTAQIPAGRLGRPEELAALAVFLASERAGYITGQSIAVDGGYLRGH